MKPDKFPHKSKPRSATRSKALSIEHTGVSKRTISRDEMRKLLAEVTNHGTVASVEAVIIPPVLKPVLIAQQAVAEPVPEVVTPPEPEPTVEVEVVVLTEVTLPAVEEPLPEVTVETSEVAAEPEPDVLPEAPVEDAIEALAEIVPVVEIVVTSVPETEPLVEAEAEVAAVAPAEIAPEPVAEVVVKAVIPAKPVSKLVALKPKKVAKLPETLAVKALEKPVAAVRVGGLDKVAMLLDMLITSRECRKPFGMMIRGELTRLGLSQREAADRLGFKNRGQFGNLLDDRGAAWTDFRLKGVLGLTGLAALMVLKELKKYRVTT